MCSLCPHSAMQLRSWNSIFYSQLPHRLSRDLLRLVRGPAVTVGPNLASRDILMPTGKATIFTFYFSGVTFSSSLVSSVSTIFWRPVFVWFVIGWTKLESSSSDSKYTVAGLCSLSVELLIKLFFEFAQKEIFLLASDSLNRNSTYWCIPERLVRASLERHLISSWDES